MMIEACQHISDTISGAISSLISGIISGLDSIYQIYDAARIAYDLIKMIISAVVEGCLTDWIWIVFECGAIRGGGVID